MPAADEDNKKISAFKPTDDGDQPKEESGLNQKVADELSDISEQAADRIRRADNILIALSKDPSVDEISAAISFTMILNALGKHVTAIYSGKTPNALEFLRPDDTFEKNTDSLQDFIIVLNKAKADHLRYKIEGDFVKVYITPYRSKITEQDFTFDRGDFNVDLVVSFNVESGDALDEALANYGRIMHDATAINITTSVPGRFAEIEWSDPAISSVCEMVTVLAEKLGFIEYTQEIATAILTGIVAATEHFSNGRNTSATMALAAKLMSAGADQQLISNNIKKEDSKDDKSADKPAEEPKEEKAEEKPEEVKEEAKEETKEEPAAEEKPAEAEPLPVAETTEATGEAFNVSGSEEKAEETPVETPADTPAEQPAAPVDNPALNPSNDPMRATNPPMTNMEVAQPQIPQTPQMPQAPQMPAVPAQPAEAQPMTPAADPNAMQPQIPATPAAGGFASADEVQAAMNSILNPGETPAAPAEQPAVPAVPTDAAAAQLQQMMSAPAATGMPAGLANDLANAGQPMPAGAPAPTMAFPEIGAHGDTIQQNTAEAVEMPKDYSKMMDEALSEPQAVTLDSSNVTAPIGSADNENPLAQVQQPMPANTQFTGQNPAYANAPNVPPAPENNVANIPNMYAAPQAQPAPQMPAQPVEAQPTPMAPADPNMMQPQMVPQAPAMNQPVPAVPAEQSAVPAQPMAPAPDALPMPDLGAAPAPTPSVDFAAMPPADAPMAPVAPEPVVLDPAATPAAAPVAPAQPGDSSQFQIPGAPQA